MAPSKGTGRRPRQAAVGQNQDLGDQGAIETKVRIEFNKIIASGERIGRYKIEQVDPSLVTPQVALFEGPMVTNVVLTAECEGIHT